MSAGAGGFIPPKKDVKFVQNAGSPKHEDSEQGKWKSKKQKRESKQEICVKSAMFAESFNKVLEELGYTGNNYCESWHYHNVAKAIGFDQDFSDFLIMTFIADWENVKARYPELSRYNIPDCSALDTIKYRFIKELLTDADYPVFIDMCKTKKPHKNPSWALDLDEKLEREADKSSEKLGKERADINQDRFDYSKAKYVTPDTVQAPSLQPRYHNGALIIQENYLEAPGTHIKHGYDREVVCVELYPVKEWLDAKAVPYLPKWTIKVNGPGTDPILSRFFGYVPDGKYLKSQHESPEAFEHHKKIAVESMSFFIKVPHIYSRFMAVATNNPAFVDYDKEYEITLGIARGLPRLGYLCAMIRDMGFPSWETYYDWYIKCYNETIFKLFGGSIQFETKCHGKVPVFTYDFRKDGFMGLNPCEEILDKPFTSVVRCEKPYCPIFRLHTDAPLESIKTLLQYCKEYDV